MAALVHRVRAVAGTLAVVALTTTCEKEPTSPKEAPPAETARALIEAELSVTLNDGVDDLLTRVVPALGDEESVAPLEGSLRALRTALASRDVEAIRSTRARVGDALDAFASGDDREAVMPDLAVVRLIIDDIDAAVGTPPIDSQPATERKAL